MPMKRLFASALIAAATLSAPCAFAEKIDLSTWTCSKFQSSDKDTIGVVLAWLDGSAVGCAGLRPLGKGVLELKHFFLAREARGRGLGRVFLAGVEEVARAQGARRIVLDTAAQLLEAAGLYRSAGYGEIPRYNDNPHAVAWFGRDL